MYIRIMKRNRVSILERRATGLKQNQTSSQRKATLSNPKVMRKNITVTMVNTRSVNEHKANEKAMEEPTVPARETDLETPHQSIDGVERKTTKSTQMPNAEEQEKKTIEISQIDIVDVTTSNTPETIKDDSETKRTSFTERSAAMVGMKPTEKEDVITTTEKCKTCGTVSAITTETKQDEEQVTHGATANQEKNLEQIDKKLKYCEEDRQELKREARHNKNGNLDNCFNLARATEEKLQQMSDKKDMVEMKKRYDTLNEKLFNLDTRMYTMGKEQAENLCAIQSKLDALLRNSITQDKLVLQNTSVTRVEFVEPQRKKRESTPLTRIDSTMASGGIGTAMKVGVSNSSRTTEDSGSHTGVQPDPMTWAYTWETMNKTLEAFSTRNTDSSDRGSGKSRKTFKKPKEFKNNSDGALIHGLRQ